MTTADGGGVAPGDDGTREIESDIEATDGREAGEILDSPWYNVPTGRRLVAGFVVLTLLAVATSVGTTSGNIDALWSLNEPIPFDVYLYGFLGAMARSLLVFVTDMDPQTDDEKFLERSWIQMARLGLRPFGALCLAAGIYLASGAFDDATVVGTALPVSLLAGTAFIAGFYVERAYEALGVVADRLLSLTETEGGQTEGETHNDSNESEPSWSLASFVLLPTQRRPEQPRWYRDRRSQTLFMVGLAVTGLAVVVTIDPELLPFVPALNNRVPVDIYLYAFLGAMGYVFTTLFAEFNKGVPSLIQKCIRIPAALLLAAGFHMFTFLFIAGDSPDEPTRLLAGLAFLVGLYVNVALISLDAIASRVFSRFAKKPT
jgi:hypothetical protein